DPARSCESPLKRTRIAVHYIVRTSSTLMPAPAARPAKTGSVSKREAASPAGTRFRLLMTRALACIEFYGIYAAGVVLGCGVVVRYLRSPNPDVSLKLLRAFGAVIGSNTTIKGSVFLDNV